MPENMEPGRGREPGWAPGQVEGSGLVREAGQDWDWEVGRAVVREEGLDWDSGAEPGRGRGLATGQAAERE